MLCDKAKEILMDESNVQVCLFIYSFVLMSYLSLPLSLSLTHTHAYSHTNTCVFMCSLADEDFHVLAWSCDWCHICLNLFGLYAPSKVTRIFEVEVFKIQRCT